MANPNIDDTFKRFFEERTLAPKDNSWDRLETLMPENEPIVKKNNRPMYWAAAATFIGFLMALIMWNQNVEITKQTVTYSKENINSVHEVSAANADELIVIGNEDKPKAQELLKVRNQVTSVKRNTSDTNFVNDMRNISVEQVMDHEIDKIVSADIDNIVVNALKKNKPYTKISIDADRLLKEVNQKLDEKNPSSAIASLSFRPDPSKLLEDAEIASERTTFQKLFKSLQSNSETLFATVADRNYQK